MNGQNPAEVVSWDLRGSGSLYHSDTLGKRKVHVVGFSKVSLKLLLSVLQSLADFPWRRNNFPLDKDVIQCHGKEGKDNV